MELFANAISLDLFILDEVQTVPSASSTASPEIIAPPEEIHSSRSHGLHFVRKLGERNMERIYGHGLVRDERIKNSPLNLHQSLIFGDDQAPLYPNPVQPTFNDSIVLLHIFLSNLVRLAFVAAGSPPPPDDYEYPPGDHFEADDGIATGVGIDAATASAKFLFRIFRTYYLTKFTPHTARFLQMDGVPRGDDQDFGFPTCPPSILRTLLRFLIGYCLDNNEGHNSNHWPNVSTASSSSPATPILKSIVLSSYETREMLHEILRQALVLPCTNPAFRDITRGAIHILGVWILGNEDERPSFLRRTGSWSAIHGTVTRSSSLGSVQANSPKVDIHAVGSVHSSPVATHNQEYKDADANQFLRRYFYLIRSIFENHWVRSSEQRLAILQGSDWEGLIALYKDAINVYRAVTVARGGIDMEPESWELLLQCLLDIQEWFMNQQNKCQCIPVQAIADDFANYICETLLHAFVRAKISHLELWQVLRERMVASMQWPQSLTQWVKIMYKTTRLLSSRLYRVDYDAHPSEKLSQDENRHSYNQGTAVPGNRTRSRARSRHLSMQGDIRSAKRSGSGRPLSSGGSDSQLKKSIEETTLSSATPNDSINNPAMTMRDISNVSLSDKASTTKTSDRRSGYLADGDDPFTIEEESESGYNNTPTRSAGGSIKFGIKSGMPSTSFSTSSQSLQQNQQQQGPSQVIACAATTSASSSRRSAGRRTVSIHNLDTLWQDSSSKLLNFVNHGTQQQQQQQQQQHSTCDMFDINSRSMISGLSKEDEDKKLRDWDKKSTNSLSDKPIMEENMTVSSKSNRTSVSIILPPGEMVALMTTTAAVNEKLPAALGIFRSSEFLNLFSMAIEGNAALAVWKNMLCSIGNINDLKDAQNYAVAMACIVDIWDTLYWIRSQQPFRDVARPALYEIAPWLLQATELPQEYDVGRAAAYGCLCRLMSQCPEENIPIRYYAHFYRAVLKGLSSGDSTIIEAIILNSGRMFSCALPGSDSEKDVSASVRRSCITILGSLVSISNHLTSVKINIDDPTVDWIGVSKGKEFIFANIKFSLKNLLIKLVNASATKEKQEQDIEAHCMLLSAICVLTLDELLNCDRQVYSFVLWFSRLIVIVQEVLTKVIDALNVHLKYYERHCSDGRGFIISKLFSYLLEWLMKLLPHPPVMRSTNPKKKELPFKFKLINEKRPALHPEYSNVMGGSDVSESDQDYVKESAEAVLLHLLHHFNNFSPPYGPATIHSTIVGPGVANDDKDELHQYQYFSFNETTIVAFVELPETETQGPRARVIIRDITGRYVWDAEAAYANDVSGKYVLRASKAFINSTQRDFRIGDKNPDCRMDMDSPLPLTQLQSSMVGRLGEQLTDFLQEEAENNDKQESDVGLWYSKMNILRRKDASERTDSLHAHLTANFSLRKDFLPAFPQEAEKSHVPFQQSRLLLSHLGFINYEHLKDKSFQMLNKSPALYRDLRGLDRKQGRETMKIAVIYVGPGQEDEQSILHNNQGSPMYKAFVNSLGWEIDIATHPGYLGGLERNLTNGTRTNYYCSSTLEMVFHDVTKMPTEADDPKQLKKKRHIGNDHVHIVWNEHERDYRIGTIGGDFGNAQIVVNPLSNGLFAIRVYRDEKIPHFGPLFDRMVVSQATLGPLVRATAINAFRASVHTSYYSFYKTVFAQRANDVKTIAHRHKIATWYLPRKYMHESFFNLRLNRSYEQFMEKIFMTDEE
ncbi:hypothetical protein BX666DRAFT_1859621 [Dichotomocladium elegans]|nr:hypothetical protein BX666DRAFT_1859621 [Dichotomocladium elegans]